MSDKISPIKERILYFIENQDITKKDFCKKTGISYANLRGKSLLSEIGGEQISEILSQYDEISSDWLLTGRGPMLRNVFPVAHQTSVPGDGIPLIPIDAIAGLPQGESIAARFIDCAHYVIPEFANLNVEYMIRVSGSSMYPKYSNGDILACRRVHDVLFFQWGKIYVIDSSQGALVKRVFQDEDPERILLVSDNKEHYPPFSIPKSDIRSLSIVVGVIRLE